MRTILHPAGSSRVASDLALLLSRAALGVILVAHGWQKLTEWTVGGTADSFASMGIFAPTAAAYFVTDVEVVAGIALIIGLLTPIAAALNAVNMLGAILLVHAQNGLWVDAGGIELVLAIFAGLAILAVFGAGRLSIDGALGTKVADSEQAGVPEPSRTSS